MNKLQVTSLVILRLLIGWHFLYEGVVKLFNPAWSAKGYLAGSDSFFGLFSAMASSDALIGFIDVVNTWLLVLVGLSLILGILNKPASLAGMALLALYYLAYPAIPGFDGSAPKEGSYILVNKNLIELFALMVIMAFPTTEEYGLKRFFSKSGKTSSITH